MEDDATSHESQTHRAHHLTDSCHPPKARSHSVPRTEGHGNKADP